MTPESIAAAQLEAITFVDRAREALETIAENKIWDDKLALNTSGWFAFVAANPRPRSLVKASGALRRQSMELTRALAEMRKP